MDQFPQLAFLYRTPLLIFFSSFVALVALRHAWTGSKTKRVLLLILFFVGIWPLASILLTAFSINHPSIAFLARRVPMPKMLSATPSLPNWSEKPTSELLASLGSPDALRSSLAFQALVTQGEKSVGPLLAELAESPEHRKLTILQILARNARPRAIPAMISLLDDASPDVARQAARVLASIGTVEAARPILERFMANKLPPGTELDWYQWRRPELAPLAVEMLLRSQNDPSVSSRQRELLIAWLKNMSAPADIVAPALIQLIMVESARTPFAPTPEFRATMSLLESCTPLPANLLPVLFKLASLVPRKQQECSEYGEYGESDERTDGPIDSSGNSSHCYEIEVPPPIDSQQLARLARNIGAPAVSPIAELLKHSDVEFQEFELSANAPDDYPRSRLPQQRFLYLSLLQLGEPAEPILLDELKSGSLQRKLLILTSLENLKELPRGFVTVLPALIENSETSLAAVRAALLYSRRCSTVEQGCRDLEPALTAAYRSSDQSLVNEALDGILALKPPTATSFTLLASALRQGAPATQRKILHSLSAHQSLSYCTERNSECDEVLTELEKLISSAPDVASSELAVAALYPAVSSHPRAMNGFTNALDDARIQIRKKAFEVLSGTRNTALPEEITEQLKRSLSDEDPAIRSMALQLLITRHEWTMDVATFARAGLKDPDCSVRLTAAGYLKLRKVSPEVYLPAIAEVLEGNVTCDRFRRITVVQFLRDNPPLAPSVLPAIARQLKNPTFVQSPVMLIELLKQSTELPPEIVEALGEVYARDESQRSAILQLYAKHGVTGRPEIRAALHDRILFYSALPSLLRDPETANETFTAVLEAVMRKEIFLNSTILEALKSGKSSTLTIIPELLRQENEPRTITALNLVSALGEITPEIVAPIVSLVGDRRDSIAQAASRVVPRFGEAALSALLPIVQELHEQGKKRQAIILVCSIGKMKARAHVAVPLFIKFLDNEDEATYGAAAWALDDIRTPEAISALRYSLGLSYPAFQVEKAVDPQQYETFYGKATSAKWTLPCRDPIAYTSPLAPFIKP